MKYDSGYVSADCQAPTSATITPTGAVKDVFSSGGDSVLVFVTTLFAFLAHGSAQTFVAATRPSLCFQGDKGN